uniref:AlNc14C139G7198 protein n=1 Tax=Albugo laibachii Nc14 TaxID=890382 RepID=F0WL09_9STRA|nr:AlNc14C139G7198 [Albugo laibachii Nc14]|eukprot:CCA21968.1 AlNc14C139G7198 [Albugo laibachii Nc14]
MARSDKDFPSPSPFFECGIPSQSQITLTVEAVSPHPTSVNDPQNQSHFHPFFHKSFAFRSHSFTPKRIISPEDLKLQKPKAPHTRDHEDEMLGRGKGCVPLELHPSRTIEETESNESNHGDLQLDSADLAFFDDIFEFESILVHPHIPPNSTSTERMESSLSSSNEGMETPTISENLLNKWTQRDRQIGAYSPEARMERIQRFREKRKHRVYHKRVKYDCRKRLANACPRIRGRFVKREKCVESGLPSVDSMR